MNRRHSPDTSASVPESELRAFLRERDLEGEWDDWQIRREGAEQPPEDAGIDFAPDMRDRRKGDRRSTGGRRASDRRPG